jgi:hypothetical protein
MTIVLPSGLPSEFTTVPEMLAMRMGARAKPTPEASCPSPMVTRCASAMVVVPG